MAKQAKVPQLTGEMPLREAAQRLLVARLADVRAREAEVLEEPPGEKGVHALRVATRRLTAGLQLLGDKRLRRLSKRVDRLKDALGPVRDLHVQGEWLATHDRDAGKRYVRSEKEQVEALQSELRRFRHRVAPELAVSIAGLDSKGKFHGSKVRHRLRRALDKLDGRAAAALDEFTPPRIHAARIAAKKLRYALELVRDAVDGAAPVLELLEPMQEQLGTLHDLDARLDLLEDLGASARVRASVAKEREALAPDVRQSLERWSTSRTVARLRDAL